MSFYEEYKCSQCGHETDTSTDSDFDCPSCGIPMDFVKSSGGEENGN